MKGLFFLCGAFKQKENVDIYFNNFLIQLVVWKNFSLPRCVVSSDEQSFQRK